MAYESMGALAQLGCCPTGIGGLASAYDAPGGIGMDSRTPTAGESAAGILSSIFPTVASLANAGATAFVGERQSKVQREAVEAQRDAAIRAAELRAQSWREGGADVARWGVVGLALVGVAWAVSR